MLNIHRCRELRVAIQIYRGILKQRGPANYNTPIYLCIYLDFLYTCRDVGCCGPRYLRPVWRGSASPGQATVCCIKAGLFILGTHNDAAVPVPETALFSRPPPSLRRMLDLAGSHWCSHQECCTGAGDAWSWVGLGFTLCVFVCMCVSVSVCTLCVCTNQVVWGICVGCWWHFLKSGFHSLYSWYAY